MLSSFRKPYKVPRNVRVKGSAGSVKYEFRSSQACVGYFGVSSFERWPSKSSPIYHLASCILKEIIKKHTGQSVEAHGQLMGAFLGTTWRNDWATAGTSAAIVIGSPIYSVDFIAKIQRNEAAAADHYLWTNKAFTLNIGVSSADLAKTFHEKAWELAYNLLNHFCVDRELTGFGSTSDGFGRPELYGYHVVSVMDANAVGSRENNSHATFFRHPIVRLDDRKIGIKCRTFIKVHNMVPNENADNTEHNDLSVLGTNPLTYRIFHFRDPYPALRKINLYDRQNPQNADGHTGTAYGYLHPVGGAPANQLMIDVNGDGIIKLTNNTDGIVGWRKHPTPEMFTNLSKWSSGMFRQDEIKQHTMMFKFYGYINDFFKRYIGDRVNVESGETEVKPSVMLVPANSNHLLGTHCMFSFEHLMSDPDDAFDLIKFDVNVSRYTHVTMGKRVNRQMIPYRQDDWGVNPTTIEGVVIPGGYEAKPVTAVKNDTANTGIINGTTDNDMVVDAVQT